MKTVFLLIAVWLLLPAVIFFALLDAVISCVITAFWWMITALKRRDAQDSMIANTNADDPIHPFRYRYEYNTKGQITACIYMDDPANPKSYRIKRDAQDRVVAYIYACDPKSPDSRQYEYDANDSSCRYEYDPYGEIIACTYACDPTHFKSWRENEEAISP